MACAHFQEYKSTFGVEPFKIIHGYFVASLERPVHQVWVSCFGCGVPRFRTLACMHCVYMGCSAKHAKEHSRNTSHYIFVELVNGSTSCLVCNDNVYDVDFEEVASGQLVAQRRKGAPTRYIPWYPSVAEERILRQHKSGVKLKPTSGMRGIVNLGSTCYMNCIMQALLHTPMLRDYFFADKHICYADNSNDCLICHFTRLFQEYYNDDQSTLSLHKILYLVWREVQHLSGDGQKDSHEFFIATLNLIHQNSLPKDKVKADPCKCIIDVIFHGKMQSDIVCQSCTNVSTTIDPIWDISLDIPDPPLPADLFQCLTHFTRPEALGSLAKIRCNSCNSYQESTKQLTFKTLPIVIVIHLKRFERDNLQHKKKTTFVEFPMEIDMSPFMSGWRNKGEQEVDETLVNSLDPNCDHRYTLYAVVVHTGSLNSGHYISYIKQTHNSWYKCNDVYINPAPIDEVMNSEGYLLFYHKNVLAYE